jgi:hypothetical protein
LDALAAPPPIEPAPYTYAATDNAPRQTREIELCEKASHFDWQYTGAFALGFVGSIFADVGPLKQSGAPGLRLLGPGLLGFTWGGFLGGGYLSLPKCDPQWAWGPPPEGNVRATWPLATAIAVVAGATAPVMDYTFLGAVKPSWPIGERSARVLVAATTGVLGAIFPYVLSPRTWSAFKEIERIRLDGMPYGGSISYTRTF